MCMRSGRIRYKHPVHEVKDRRSLFLLLFLSFLKAKMHFTMSENALARKGERGSYFTRPNPKFTRQCERASGILHPCFSYVNNKGTDQMLVFSLQIRIASKLIEDEDSG